MAQKQFDIDRLITGMTVVNREKEEIKIVLQFLCPYLRNFGERALITNGEMLALKIYPHKEIEIFSVVSRDGDAWLKFTAQKTYHGFAINLLYGYGAGDQHTLLRKDSDEKVALHVEGLSICPPTSAVMIYSPNLWRK